MIIALLSSAVAQPNMQEALEVFQQKKVDYSSHLGEGEGHFDSASRAIDSNINCMTWLQGVLAYAYGTNEEQRQAYLDSIRYYDSTISFGTRKHYVDRWLYLEPHPLIPYRSTSCAPDQSSVLSLDRKRFAENNGYTGSFYQENQFNIPVEYHSTESMNTCLRDLEEGYYVLFFLANDAYLQIWGKHGAMGQVHSLIVERNTGIQIHHASMDYGKVVTEEWSVLRDRLSVVSKGYTLYRLDPLWVPKKEFQASPL